MAKNGWYIGFDLDTFVYESIGFDIDDLINIRLDL